MAITITLLMLDIRLPQPAGGMSDGELWAALLSIWPRYLAYVVSFLVIALFWISHRQKFRWVVRTDGVLVSLNILFLLCLGLIPFVTGLIADNPGHISTMVYAGVMAAVSAIITGLWVYATRAGLVAATLPVTEFRRIFWRSVYAVVVFAISICGRLVPSGRRQAPVAAPAAAPVRRLRSGFANRPRQRALIGPKPSQTACT